MRVVSHREGCVRVNRGVGRGAQARSGSKLGRGGLMHIRTVPCKRCIRDSRYPVAKINLGDMHYETPLLASLLARRLQTSQSLTFDYLFCRGPSSAFAAAATPAASSAATSRLARRFPCVNKTPVRSDVDPWVATATL
jgi:hypothetical protein